jgi:hypothetical protein
MANETATLPDAAASCSGCEACCCLLEVLLITDAGLPDRYIEVDRWGGMRMARLDDGWCSALDRNTMEEFECSLGRALEGGYKSASVLERLSASTRIRPRGTI